MPNSLKWNKSIGSSLWGRSDSEQTYKSIISRSSNKRTLSLNGPETAQRLIKIAELAEIIANIGSNVKTLPTSSSSPKTKNDVFLSIPNNGKLFYSSFSLSFC